MIKVYELARELKLESKLLLTKLHQWGIQAQTHMAALDDKTAAQVRARIKKGEEPVHEKKKPILIKRKSSSPESLQVEEISSSVESAQPVSAESEKPSQSEVPQLNLVNQEPSPEVVHPNPLILETIPLTNEPHPFPAVPAPSPLSPQKEEKKKGEKEVKPAVDKKAKLAKLNKDKSRKTDRLLLLTQEEILEGDEAPDLESGESDAVVPQQPPKVALPSQPVRSAVVPGTPPRESASRPPMARVQPQRRSQSGGYKKKDRHRGTQVLPEGTKARKKSIRISEGITLKEYADRLGLKAQEVILKLMGMGVMATINQPMDLDAAVLIAESFGVTVEVQVAETEDELLGQSDEDESEHLVSRPPVVTIMGHTDHGKTSLLDAIRKTKLAEGEAGGITQHIGAYTISEKGREITFLDTPGHEAFTAMRARGTQITDVVVLVVAADDGVMPQTIEAIHHAKAAGVPIVVALNKVDKPEANPEKVMQELSVHELIPEAWGGQTIFCPVSAKKRSGLDNLLEMILLQADVLDLKANPDRRAQGVVIESKLDKGRGSVATVLVQKGTLKVGDFVVVGGQFGRVRTLINDKGQRVTSVLPSHPAEIVGLDGVPNPGDTFVVVDDEKAGRQVAQSRVQKLRLAQMVRQKRVSLEDLYTQIQDGEIKELNLILKVDVQGSIEPIKHALSKLGNEKVRVRFIHEGVGGIKETDVLLAQASSAIILGFNVRPDSNAAQIAEREKVDIKFYSVIYDAIEDIRKAMEGLLAPTLKEKILGRAEVRKVYNISKVGNVCGCYVIEGIMQRAGTSVRLLRDSVVIFEGRFSALKRFKDDVREVATGYECGISIENYQDIKMGDIVECFMQEQIAATLDS
ncbi:translation initiation factor IF-2 [Leptospirillum ferrooxidans]|uniref:Translation initiation factor IF-2 n=1 Tax=Leptospirillum ferrooxidans (strain C2-3) TaxID=1162668 RepID=I0IPR3_LEPFC|nr:translation initiation factor IF-2 [Leptospirillum ferrooxidans]BAM07262.1 putative translation initiation factor IF2 [Leptospirillum ferrooxidans C2-3]